MRTSSGFWPLAYGFWPLGSVPFCAYPRPGCLHRRTRRAVLGAVPSVTVVEHLVPARATFKLHDKYGLHVRPVTGRCSRVYRFDGHTLWEEIELIHDASGQLARFQGNAPQSIIPLQIPVPHRIFLD